MSIESDLAKLAQRVSELKISIPVEPEAMKRFIELAKSYGSLSNAVIAASLAPTWYPRGIPKVNLELAVKALALIESVKAAPPVVEEIPVEVYDRLDELSDKLDLLTSKIDALKNAEFPEPPSSLKSNSAIIERKLPLSDLLQILQIILAVIFQLWTQISSDADRAELMQELREPQAAIHRKTLEEEQKQTAIQEEILRQEYIQTSIQLERLEADKQRNEILEELQGGVEYIIERITPLLPEADDDSQPAAVSKE